MAGCNHHEHAFVLQFLHSFYLWFGSCKFQKKMKMKMERKEITQQQKMVQQHQRCVVSIHVQVVKYQVMHYHCLLNLVDNVPITKQVPVSEINAKLPFETVIPLIRCSFVCVAQSEDAKLPKQFSNAAGKSKLNTNKDDSNENKYHGIQ